MSQVPFSSSAKILPCFFLFVVFLLVGTYCQEETSQSQYKLSQLIPTNSVYEHRESDVSSAWSKKNDTSSLLRSLEENNVMDTSRLNSKENTDEEYEEEEGGGEEIEEKEEGEEGEEEEEEEGGGEEVEEEEEERDNECDPDYITDKSKCTRSEHNGGPLLNVDNFNNSKYHEYEKDPSTNHHDAYYYYEDYKDDGSQDKTVDSETIDYKDTEVYETTTEESVIEYDREEHSFTYDENFDDDIEEDDSNSTTSTDTKDVTSMQGSKKNFAFIEPPPKMALPESSILIGEAIVSVVTTKSVVNGTISIPTSTSSPMTTEQVGPPPSMIKEKHVDDRTLESATTEDSSRVLASVQTSRSISGARFLPFPVIDRVEQLNSEPSAVTPIKKTLPPSESTESIIDKLDRAQSELTSDLLVRDFASAGNALQLDVLSDRDRASRRKFETNSTSNGSTTSRMPVITKFVPKRYNDKTDTNGATSSTVRPKIAFKWPSGKTTTPLNSDDFKPTTQVSVATTKKMNIRIAFQNINTLLPPGYKLSKEDQQDLTERNPLNDILSKSKVDISRLLPADYNKKKNNEASTTPKTTKLVATTSGPPINTIAEKISLQSLFANSAVDVSALLPRDYVEKVKNESKPETESHNENNSTSTSTVSNTTKAPSGLKIVFPNRPGGRKNGHKITTPPPHRADGLPAITPRIQKGWPTRATTEFTGWPTPSTTPISIEKLLEVARTATEMPVNTSVIETTSAVSVTTTTTTTTTTPRSTTIGMCEEECEVAGTIRIIGNTTWLPELLDHNTKEWKQLANEIEEEMNSVFSKSPVLMKWYKKVRIDSFSPGSILVDFFVELVNLHQRTNTQELKVLFHDSLKTYNSSYLNGTNMKGEMKLGTFIIDPRSTDFVVIPKVPTSSTIENEDRLIPQWAVVMIVIGVGGLLFIIIFGVSVLMNRQNSSKLKPSVSTIYEDGIAKNMLGSSHATSLNRSNDYPKQVHTIWTDPDVSWNDKSFESTSNKVLVDKSFQDGKKYNLHDSWRSEWNGYYSKPSHGSSKHSGYHHHPDYDTNF